MANVILPVSPQVLKRVLAGEQLVLPRRVMPSKVQEGDRITFYCDNAIHGTATALAVHITTECNIWAVAAGARMDPNDLLGFWFGARKPGFFTLGNIRAFEKPKPWLWQPLQNFMYDIE